MKNYLKSTRLRPNKTPKLTLLINNTFLKSHIGLIYLLLLFVGCKQKDQSRPSEKVTTHTECHPSGGRAAMLATPVNDSVLPNESRDLQGITKTDLVNTEQKDMVLIPGGAFMMGAEGSLALPREFPKHPVKISGFYMDTHEVTNAEFRAFVQTTGYVTVAERPVDWEALKKQLPPGTPKPPEENLQPGSLVFTPGPAITDLSNYFQWWAWTHGANWLQPNGPGSTIDGRDDHPVVHIALEDAKAYAAWAGKRLPTEAEWEWAARGGLKDAAYPWGNKDVNEAPYECNFFQGTFPSQNSVADTYEQTAPVGSFNPNGYGLYDMAGNVWEITSDWFDENYYQILSRSTPIEDPKGPSKSFYTGAPYAQHTVIKGGSFLCNDSYCASYRVSARMPLEVDAAMNHVGFRCVKDL